MTAESIGAVTSSGWRFSIIGEPAWEGSVEALPSEDGKRAFWESAVPNFATSTSSYVPPKLSVVVAHVSAPTISGQSPGGPAGRAKCLLDALHDDRGSGPLYRDMGARALLEDDDPTHVAGLAVEVAHGRPRTTYQLGEALQIRGRQALSVTVPESAPNDIAGTPGDRAKIDAARVRYGQAVRTAFAAAPLPSSPKAVVIRHHPQRDEDNTWATWIAALCGVRRAPNRHWAAHAPLAGWSPTSVASLADTSLATPVVYEIWE